MCGPSVHLGCFGHALPHLGPFTWMLGNGCKVAPVLPQNRPLYFVWFTNELKGKADVGNFVATKRHPVTKSAGFPGQGRGIASRSTELRM